MMKGTVIFMTTEKIYDEELFDEDEDRDLLEEALYEQELEEEAEREQWIEETWQVLDNMLSESFGSMDGVERYQELKAAYEEITGDAEFSVREVTGELERVFEEADWERSNFDEVYYDELLEKLKVLSPREVDYYEGLKDRLIDDLDDLDD